MGTLLDLKGQRFNYLSVIELSHKDKWGSYHWKCKCKCGNIITVHGSHLKNLTRKSCGCFQHYSSFDDVFERNTRWNGYCREWNGYKDASGYGEFMFKKRKYKAHRAIYELKYGKIPENLVICHTCNNPACVNINHLYAGSQKENIDDRENTGISSIFRKRDKIGRFL